MRQNLTEEDHLTGKTFTQRIERTNLTQRTRVKRLNRKTISYLKSEEINDKMIGTFIEREYFFDVQSNHLIHDPLIASNKKRNSLA
ncbi:IS1 family transposase [Xenorhabdus bovienii]|uniref:IS1 family transposase n=1 Tax=Xenorhabdus bovienii TaxID=40576 RepID=A0AAJ1J7D9_XENBV|nr:IS1 family transposase [Xenorhabdus bovienii]MDE1487685.1 IS1 family transposase [Xenorhabdus bovienii]MDE1491626.1 IS1 family transposase [Xenorhabdus bovienii]MDE1496810.1 IS1 family transposase [Xenorhabdus bovienii]MDE9474776.1 IS1 family transposase [Xenorhabdus bovienii]